MEVLKYFKLELVKGSLVRKQMDDETYFGPEYKDYVSNSKMGLLNPAQGGSPQKFFEGFKSNNSSALATGSAVHQLTLEKDIYTLSNITRPGGKLGLAYDEYKKLRKDKTKMIEECMVLACKNVNYYVSRLDKYDGNSLPGFMKDGIAKCLEFNKVYKTKKTEDGKNIIYLQSDQHKKCVACVKSLKENEEIQKELNVPLSYCEDVILCDMKVTFPKDFNNPDGEQNETIVKLKMKADQWSINHENKSFVLNDVKTTGKPLQHFMGYEYEEEFMDNKRTVFKNGSWQNFHYSRQMAMYLYILAKYIEQEYGSGYKMSTNMLVVETVGAFNSKLFPVSNKQIKSGFKEFKDLLKRVAYHQVNGYEKILEMEEPDYFNI